MNLHCEGEPYAEEQYDEEIEMEKLDAQLPTEPKSALDVFTANDDSPLLFPSTLPIGCRWY